jgi:hypothetical protein
MTGVLEYQLLQQREKEIQAQQLSLPIEHPEAI